MKLYNKCFLVLLGAISLSACQQEQSGSVVVNNDKYENWEWPHLSNNEKISIERDRLLEKNYMLVFDDSGSMSGSKLETAKVAVSMFLKNIPSDINVGLLTLNQGLLAGFSRDRNSLVEKVYSINAEGGTPLKYAITESFSELTKKGKRQLGYGQYGMIIITDGAASASQNPYQIVNHIVDKTPVEIHTVGFHIDEDHVLNQKGRTFYSTANNMETLLKAMETAVAESNSFDENITFE